MLSIRPATPEDVPLLSRLVHELADYEHLAHEASVTEEDLARDAFGTHPKFSRRDCRVGWEAVGYALFSSFIPHFQGRAGLFLDDLLSAPNSARKGLEGPARARGRDRVEGKIFLHALGSAELEHAGNKLLQRPGRGVYGGMEVGGFESVIPCKPWRKRRSSFSRTGFKPVCSSH